MNSSAQNNLLIEVLGPKDRILTTYRAIEELTLLGQSPAAHLQIKGKGIAGLHVAIKNGAKPVIMDLGGPSPLIVDGKETLEHELETSTVIEIGKQRIRVRKLKDVLPDFRKQAWTPVTDSPDKDQALIRDKALTIRVRLYMNGIPVEAINSPKAFVLSKEYSGSVNTHRTVWIEGGQIKAQLPTDWIQLGGRIQKGRSGIVKLEDWGTPTSLEKDTVYRVFAGKYVLEVLVTEGTLVIGTPRMDAFPTELRKPFAISVSAVLAIFVLWITLFGRPEAKVEEPYPVYARIQNIPIEKLPEPDPAEGPQAGGGSGGAKDSTAPDQGAAQSAPSKLAQSLTGGLKSLIGSVVSNTKVTQAVVAEGGVSQVAATVSAAQTGKLAAVGHGTTSVAGAAKLGQLGIKGSGTGFNGGSGTGLGGGAGAGIGTGVGDGIGRGGFKLVEEESIVDGGLDKEVIAAVIKNNLSQIKYCYERQLVANPDLFGKVVVTWQINKSGKVEAQNIKQTTLNSTPVEQCMLAKIGGWNFPQPKNGTSVTVSYPFLFKSTK